MSSSSPPELDAFDPDLALVLPTTWTLEPSDLCMGKLVGAPPSTQAVAKLGYVERMRHRASRRDRRRSHQSPPC